MKSLLSNVLTTYREDSERNVTVITIENNNGFQQDRECTTVSEISEAMGYLQENYIYEVEILYDDVGYVTRISIC